MKMISIILIMTFALSAQADESHRINELIKKLGIPSSGAPNVEELVKLAPISVPYLIKGLKNKNNNIRYSSAYALGKTRDPRATAPLINTLQSNDPQMRFNSAVALGRVAKKNDPSVIKSLKIALSKESNEKTKEKISETIKSITTVNQYKCNTPEECFRLGGKLIIKKEFNEGFKFLKLSCDKKHAKGCFALGSLLLQRKNEKESLVFFKLSCNLNFALGCTAAGIMELKLNNINESSKHLYKSCELKDATGCSSLAVLYVKMDNFTKGIEYIKKACDFGDANSCKEVSSFINLKEINESCKNGVEVNCKQIKLLRKTINKGFQNLL